MSTPAMPQRYSVVSLLGEGGQGRVYRVRDSLRDRDLALKLVSASDAEFLRREFDTLRQIRHENLIQVFDWGTLESGDAYYTMELIEGQDWGSRMGAPQSADDVRHILTGVLRGLAHLHCHGEIHGDLKPGNILLGPGGVVKVTDIGMGGGVDGRHGGGGGIAGTPGYTAPECWEGKPADIRADLYSVGVMAYEALTGKHPFGGRTIREVVAGQMEGWVPSPAAHRVRVPAELERVVMRALERESQLRQGSADEFMEGFGVEDRVGVILGGRAVGRETVLSKVLERIFVREPRRESMFRIVGPPGSGKATLIREIAHEMSKRGARSITWDEWSQGTPKAPASDGKGFLAVLDDRDGSLEQDRDIAIARAARDAWASAVEANEPSSLVFVTISSWRNAKPGEFELVLMLEPLTLEQMTKYVDGMIGRSRFPGPLLERIHTMTGGVPETVQTAIAALIARRVLSRRDSCWQFNETTEIRSLNIPELASPWRSRWNDVESDDRVVLLCLALAEAPMSREKLSSLNVALERLGQLEARGYVMAQHGQWSLPSEGIRQGILEAAQVEEVEAVARRMLATKGALELEQRADILLKLGDPSAIEPAIQAAEAATARGAHYLSMRRYRKCRDLASRRGDAPVAMECVLREAEALILVGRFTEACELLGGDVWSSDADASLSARRHHALGIAKRGVGDVTGAAEHFEQARKLRDGTGDRGGSLWSLCELAEIRWQFGELADRVAIVDVLRSELQRSRDEGIPPDVRIALSYHLAAAHLEIGDLAAATSVLEEVGDLEASPFWKMRLRIAQGTAEHRAGFASRALRRFEEAWVECERGGIDAFRPRILTNRGATLYQQGQFRAAMIANTQGLDWARRVGNLTETMFAALGTAGCSVILGEYLAAMRDIEEAEELAVRYDDPISLEKSLELKAWTKYWLGDHGGCSEVARAAVRRFQNWTTTETRPRLYWILSLLAADEGNFGEATKWLESALVLLRRSGDPEDLPGVEIEVLRVEHESRNDVDRVDLVRRIRSISDSTEIPTVVTHAGIAIGEILLRDPGQFDAQRDFLLRSLARAEMSEMAEAGWRINYHLGAIQRLRGDERNTRIRFAAALKGLRRIADRLDSTARLRYLNARHVGPLLAAMSAASPAP